MPQVRGLLGVNFGRPEAEHDAAALNAAFYETVHWREIMAGRGAPFVIGRKGSGKSALVARLEHVVLEKDIGCVVRIRPADFRHVEVRSLLAYLVSGESTWQYIYHKLWEGIITGQIVQHINGCTSRHARQRMSKELQHEIDQFNQRCTFYVAPLGDALSDVITTYVRDAAKKTEALDQVELRRMLEPYSWQRLLELLARELPSSQDAHAGLFITIDGLDEGWDVTSASMYFLAQLLGVVKECDAKFALGVKLVVCLRDNIFRALVDTHSVEYDKIESLIQNLEWNSKQLFEMIARRVAPHKRVDGAVAELRSLLPEVMECVAIEEYLAHNILQRPRDYINFFIGLQRTCANEPVATVGDVHNAVARYQVNKLVDLENEFGQTYPRISQCISKLHGLPDMFSKTDLVAAIRRVMSDVSFRKDAARLIKDYGDAETLARILLSIGVVGTYDSKRHLVRFVHEYSESRVRSLWTEADRLAIHPVYLPARHTESRGQDQEVMRSSRPTMVTDPMDYLAVDDSGCGLEPATSIDERKRVQLLREIESIQDGREFYREFELWVRKTISLCFHDDLLDPMEQVPSSDGGKKFEILFDIVGSQPPWAEFKDRYHVHRLLVECKNTEYPSEDDFLKLKRDMDSLGLHIALMAYRGRAREPDRRILAWQRALFQNSQQRQVIVAMSQAFMVQCLGRRAVDKRRKNLNKLWREHMETWLCV